VTSGTCRSYNNRWSNHIVSLDSGKVRFQLEGDSAIESAGACNEGRWHHAVTTVGSGGQRLYLDGKLIGAGKLSKRKKGSNRLGLDLGPGGGNAQVAIDEIRIFRRALLEAEVTKLM
jgi:hypothetical protein